MLHAPRILTNPTHEKGDFGMPIKGNLNQTALLLISVILSATLFVGTALAAVPKNTMSRYWGNVRADGYLTMSADSAPSNTAGV
jgi:hypothetical protein